jgi:biotin operon repressor
MIDSGEVKSEADLARKLGISRIRVNQIVSLLKLDEQVIEMVEQLGNPMKSRIITERCL